MFRRFAALKTSARVSSMFSAPGHLVVSFARGGRFAQSGSPESVFLAARSLHARRHCFTTMKRDDPLPPEDWLGYSAQPAGLDALYRAELPRLSRFFARRVAADDVLDMVHEAFRRLLRVTSEQKTPLDCPEAYLSQVAGNLVRDQHRRGLSRSYDRHIAFDEEEMAGFEPLGQLESRDAIARVDAALLALPTKTREIFLLHRKGGHSYAEIAAARGLSVKAVEKHIAKALFELRRRLRPDG